MTKLSINGVRTAVRIVVGALFVVSAAAKMGEMDRLELYIFSFGALSLNLSFWVARLLVAFEFLLGAALVANIHRRAVAWSGLGAIGAFSAFLVYALVAGRNDNCHCLGEMVEMTPLQSLGKNVALAAALLFVLPQRGGLTPRRYLTLGLGIIVTVAIFVISPPDNINPHRNYNQALNSAAWNSLPKSSERRVVCFYSTSCEYCLLTSSKIASLARRHGLEDKVEVWFADSGADLNTQVEEFFRATLSPTFRWQALDLRQFLVTTNGEMPIVLLTEGDSIAAEYNYRTVDEGAIIDFFEE
ncbi:MAG: hypothetical protein IJ014_02985 [Rikenellaceae bacterium]|nr:hypothetical protein [Rikenellaceae bacterium]